MSYIKNIEELVYNEYIHNIVDSSFILREESIKLQL